LHYLVERAHLLREALAPQSSARRHFSDLKTIAVIVKFVSFLCAFLNKDAVSLSNILKNDKTSQPDAWILRALDSESDFVLPEYCESDKTQSGGDSLSRQVTLLHRRLLFSACLMVSSISVHFLCVCLLFFISQFTSWSQSRTFDIIFAALHEHSTQIFSRKT
jgi:hypothetical protein